MTTQINIVVDDGGLIQRNKEQTDGNRWLTLEKNGQKLTASKSKEVRDQELAKQGKGPDGKPQSTAPAKPSFRRDEPAAQRQLEDSIVIRPTQPANANTWFAPYEVAIIDAQVTGRVYAKQAQSTTTDIANLGRPTYLSASGPAGAPALASVPTAIGGPADENVISLSPLFPESFVGVKSRTTRQCTLQYYFYLCDSFSGAQSGSLVDIAIGGLAINASISSTATVVSGVIQYGNLRGLSFSSAQLDWGITANTLPWIGAWNHVALTFRDGTFYAFLNGTLMHTKQTTVKKLFLSFSSGLSLYNVRFGNSGWGYSPGPAAKSGDTVKIHGVKYETRARWTESFTPPVSLP